MSVGRKTFSALLLVLASAATAAAQSTTCQATAAAPSYGEGSYAPLSCDDSGNLRATASGTVTANQGTPNSLANGWPVEVTDGVSILGTSTHPVRTDPTGTTTQPVSGTVTANAGAGTFSVTGTGSAGTPAAGVVTVQGIASGTAQPVSGTVTANAGTGTFTTKETRGATGANTQVSCGTTATQVLAANASRLSYAVKAPAADTATIFVGFSSGVTTANGIALEPGSAMDDSLYTGAVFCIVAAGTQTIASGEISP